jgi:glycosyltransferase involved in cell wall biosynthesis
MNVSPPQARLRELYARCDVWLSASRHEGFNMPAIEAMACRTPVVATRTGWPVDVFETGVNGVLADIDDVQALADGLGWVLSRSDPEWRQLSRSAYETATAGSWDQSARRFEEALERARARAAIGEIAGGSCSQSPSIQRREPVS